jgi:small ligand-binding sensory domain FIST
MRWASGISEEPDLESAFDEATAAIDSRLAGVSADFVVPFVSEHHRRGFDRLHELLIERYPRALIFGCSARSVIGSGRELEETPGLAITGAHLPDVELQPFHLDTESLPAPDAPLAEWYDVFGVKESCDPGFLVLADPFAGDAERWIAALDRAYPKSVKIGGIASAGQHPGNNWLYLGSEIHQSGVIGVALSGNVCIDSVIAQGCRPVGHPMFVTRARDNLLIEVDGEPPVEVLQELFEEADQREQALFQSSLFLGIEMRSTQTEYHQGDFLIRNLIGGEEDSGALYVAAALHETQVVQFHLRDAQTASDDLDRRLQASAAQLGDAEGALLFSCLGRGEHLYGRKGHDSQLFAQHAGELPLSGFFCNGEIGPVEHQTFLHGYTSAFGIFRPRS